MSTALSVAAGDTFSVALTVLRADGVTPVDLTGATVKFSFSTVSKTTANGGITVTNAAQGLATVNLLPADTAALTAIAYAYDVIVIEASGARSTVAYGSITITDHPTKT